MVYNCAIVNQQTPRNMIKLSQTSKLDGIKSWSLQARTTCPGSIGNDGELVPACSGCYAAVGFYSYPKAKAVREANREAWQHPDWVAGMSLAMNNDRYFRWFDSGDMYALDLAEKIYQVMVKTPGTMHWLPTRMHKFPKFKAIIDKMMALPNVMVRPSSDAIDGTYTPGVHGSTIIQTPDDAPAGVTPCLAYEHGGKCNGCRSCWDKSVAVIAYSGHGKRMKKLIRIAKENV